jgi:hypothetical protein
MSLVTTVEGSASVVICPREAGFLFPAFSLLRGPMSAPAPLWYSPPMPRQPDPLVTDTKSQGKFHLRRLYGWFEMDPAEQHFLAAYPLFRDIAQTARFIGKTPDWANDLKKASGQFEGNIERVDERVLDVYAVRFYEEEWMGKQALAVMKDALSGKGAAKVTAAKYLLDRIYPRKRGRPQTKSPNGKSEEDLPEIGEGLGLEFLNDD